MKNWTSIVFYLLWCRLEPAKWPQHEIRRRLAMARTSTTKLWKIWKDRSVNIKTKLRLLKSLIWPIALYGCKTWTLKAADEKKLTAFELWSYRRIVRISYFNKKTNEHVLNTINTSPIITKLVIQRKLRYFGHISRATGSLEQCILQEAADGRRSRGRQRISWMDNIRNWTGLTASMATSAATDRSGWKRVVTNALAECGTQW